MPPPRPSHPPFQGHASLLVALGALPLALLQLEAAYCAAAVSAYELHDHLDFTPLLRSRLLAELGSSGPLSSLLKRRVLRLVACWVTRLEGSDRPPLYRAVNACLWNTDPCLQLGAVACLHALVDDWGFEDQQFAEFLAPCCSGLLHRVLPACKELESHTLVGGRAGQGSQGQVFNLLNVVIERMGDLMRPHVEGLLALMPGLWSDHGGQSLVQVQILLALQRLVNVLGAESSVAYPLLLPMLQYATDPRQPDALHLLEDGLGLWLVAVRNALTPEPGLLGLLPHLALAMGQSTEHLQHACALLSSLVLLGRDPFVAQFHAELNTIFVGSLGNVNERGHLLLLPVMERCLAAAPASAPQALQPALLKLLGMVLKGKESRLTVAAACCVLARLLLHSPQTLLDLLAQAAAQGLTVVAKPGWAPSLTPPELLLAGLMEEWCDHSDVIAQPRQRKLSALGLCTLLTLPSAASLACLDVIVASITGVWFELEGGNDSTPGDRDAAATAKLYSGDDSGFDAELNCAAMSEDAQGETDRRIQASPRA
ncbi:hypothetical protein QJQ45_021952 [Haematococcus lacustris]|nr:hypothetical protein QJQ45_021952 [Haematococcus lacustris]